MKKALFLFLALVTVSSFAQSNVSYFTLSPGYLLQREPVESSFVPSIDYAYYFTPHFAIHLGASKYAGQMSQLFKYRYYNYITTVKSPFAIVEIGPEFKIASWETAFLYVQLNVGHTYGSTQGEFTYEYQWLNGFPYSQVVDGEVRSNKYTIGAALGIRAEVTKYFLFGGQISYHRLQNMYDHPNIRYHPNEPHSWTSLNYLDVRITFTVRF